MGGAGIVFCEETSVEERGRKSYRCAGIYDDAHIAQYRRINDFIRSQGAVPAIQLGHSGRKGSGCAPWDGYRSLTADDAKHGEPPVANGVRQRSPRARDINRAARTRPLGNRRGHHTRA